MKSVFVIVDDDGKLFGIFVTEDQADWAHSHEIPSVMQDATHVEHWVLNEVYL